MITIVKFIIMLTILILFELIFIARKIWKLDEFLLRLIGYLIVILILGDEFKNPNDFLKGLIGAIVPVVQLMYRKLGGTDVTGIEEEPVVNEQYRELKEHHDTEMEHKEEYKEALQNALVRIQQLDTAVDDVASDRDYNKGEPNE